MTNQRIRKTIIAAFILLFGSCSIAFGSDTPKIKILMSPIPPLVMEKNQNKSGVLWDLAQVIKNLMAEENISVSTTILPWSRAYAELQGSENIIMLQMARTTQREALFNWILETGELSFGFVATSTPAINTIEEAQKLRKIAVYRGSRLEQFLKNKGFKKSLVLTDDSATSARLLSAGRVNAWYASIQETLWLRKAGVLKKEPVIGNAILNFPIWAVTSRQTSSEINEKLRDTLLEIIETNQMNNIRSSYGLQG